MVIFELYHQTCCLEGSVIHSNDNTLVPKLGASSVVEHLAGLGIKVFLM
jgi:hypothetical protein